MKLLNKFMFCILAGILTLMVMINIKLFNAKEESIPQDAITDINRAYKQLQEGSTIKELQISNIQVQEISKSDLTLSLYSNHAKERMIVLATNENNRYYVFEYTVDKISNHIIWLVNGSFLVLMCIIVLVYLYVMFLIYRPYKKFEYIAQAMKNRDFSYELPKQKHHVFGKFIWAIDVIREELKYHEEKELQLMREHKTLIASISHDMKTPLSTIRLYSDALKNELYDHDVISKRINENCDKIDRFVKDIQRTSSEHLFHFDVHMEEVYLHQIMDILHNERERILLKKVKYDQGYFQDVLLRCDIHKLREVISNVIDNALKYGDGKWIHVKFREEEHHLLIEIENSGCEIDEVDRDVIFQSFYRGNNIGKEQGNGLGLYICKQLMKMMNGDIYMTQRNGRVSFHLILELL